MKSVRIWLLEYAMMFPASLPELFTPSERIDERREEEEEQTVVGRINSTYVCSIYIDLQHSAISLLNTKINLL